MITKKLKVEIWSDFTCVHCYIAKRKFEHALSQFNHKDAIEIIWKSFELAPSLSVDKSKSMYEFLAEYNRASLEQVNDICSQITSTAKGVGLIYNFDIAKPANSFRAHRLSHLAQHFGLQNKAKEVLFRAHFTQGENIDDLTTLTKLGVEIGLDQAIIVNTLESDRYAHEVRQDIQQAHQAGVKSIPLYRFNRKFEISGARDSEVFLEAMEKAYEELQLEIDQSDQSCKIGEICT
jgi:predicted DsbA family dithiol-disulfide isomerase